MLTLPTLQAMKLTENTILVTGIGRGRTEAFHALGHKVIIAGRRKQVLEQTADAGPGIGSADREDAIPPDEGRSACVSL
jgi:short-subunit dehydrogenase involved in D-alanine esterification of teichoic acids